jgi:hypothetical protein
MIRQHTAVNSFEKRAFALLVFAIFSLAGLYSYFISMSIVHVIEREEAENGIASLNSAIGELESQYIVRKEAITVENAYALGLVDLKKKTFVLRRSGAGGLTLQSGNGRQ